LQNFSCPLGVFLTIINKNEVKGSVMKILYYLGAIMCSAVIQGETKLELSSPDFEQGQSISKKFTCDGNTIAPRLFWEGTPRNTKSFALIVDDPDAPTPEPWVHWVVFNIPGINHALLEPLGRTEKLLDGTIQGTNTSKHIGYDGPCPPPCDDPVCGVHRYFFNLYALDTVLNLQPGATKEELIKAMKGHVLGQAQLIGTYQRMKK
jgi:Raf kinase inhibitor-like YbhB/YbcL family protein